MINSYIYLNKYYLSINNSFFSNPNQIGDLASHEKDSYELYKIKNNLFEIKRFIEDLLNE